MPGPIHDFARPIVLSGTMEVALTPFGASLVGAMSAIAKARETSLAPTGWTSRTHDNGKMAPPEKHVYPDVWAKKRRPQ